MSRYQNTCLTVTATIEGENEAGKERTGTALINTPEGVVAATVTSLGDDPAGLGVLVEANVSAEVCSRLQSLLFISCSFLSSDHRDYRRDERRDRDTRRRDDSRERERSRERDRERDRDRETDRRGDGKESSRREVPPPKDSTRSSLFSSTVHCFWTHIALIDSPTSKPDSEYYNNAEAGQVPEDDDTAMMAMMGMAGFGSTKVCRNVASSMPYTSSYVGQACRR